jgi:hypothetical protein
MSLIDNDKIDNTASLKDLGNDFPDDNSIVSRFSAMEIDSDNSNKQILS